MGEYMEKYLRFINKLTKEFEKILEMLFKDYDKINKDFFPFSHSQKELEYDFDLYTQCLLLKVALADIKLEKSEIEFVQSYITSRNNNIFALLVKEIDLKNFNLISEYIEKRLAEVPVFIKVFAKVDQFITSHNLHPENYSRMIYNYLTKLLLSMAMIDGKVNIVEVVEASSDLEKLLLYYQNEGIEVEEN